MTAARPLTHLIQGIIIDVWQSLSKSRSEKSMDHSHHDRTYKKSRFQQELEQSVSRKLISSLLLGCLLFCIAIAVVNALNQNAGGKTIWRVSPPPSMRCTITRQPFCWTLDTPSCSSPSCGMIRTTCVILSAITTSRLLWRYSSSLPTPREMFGSRPFRRER